MFGIEPSEFLLVALVALVVIGPKDLPKAMRVVGFWVGKARGVARQFRSGFDEIVREAELDEMEKRWAKENERIMREHPQPVIDHPALDQPVIDHPVVDHQAKDDVGHHAAAGEAAGSDHDAVMKALPPATEAHEPVHVEKPVVAPAPVDEPRHPPHDGVSS